MDAFDRKPFEKILDEMFRGMFGNPQKAVVPAGPAGNLRGALKKGSGKRNNKIPSPAARVRRTRRDRKNP